MPGLPPGKTDGFSWYAMHATQPERVKNKQKFLESVSHKYDQNQNVL